jgi:periplasmic protein TonB
MLGGAVMVSVMLHVLGIAVALLAFGRHAPAAEDPASITVFVPPAVETSEAKPAETPPPPPEPDFTLPPPEESLAVPDFKSPTPPPKPPPRPVPPKPAVAATPRAVPAVPSAPQQIVPPVNSAPSPSPAPSVVPGWNVQLAAWLASHKRYPPDARNRGEEGEVTIRFTVDGAGSVREVAVAKGSGHATLDAAAVAMLQGARVPAPGAAATRTVRIHFRLDE